MRDLQTALTLVRALNALSGDEYGISIHLEGFSLIGKGSYSAHSTAEDLIERIIIEISVLCDKKEK